MLSVLKSHKVFQSLPSKKQTHEKSTKFPLISNPTSISSIIPSKNPEKSLPLIPIEEKQLKISCSNIIRKPTRNSLLTINTKPLSQNNKFFTQNSHPISLHEKPIFVKFDETLDKKHLEEMILVKKEKFFRRRGPSIEKMPIKMMKIKPELVELAKIDEKNSASTRTTGILSRDGLKTPVDLKEMKSFLLKNPPMKILKIQRKSPFSDFLMKSQRKNDSLIVPMKNNNDSHLMVEKLPINESLIIDDDPNENTKKNEVFSDLHLIKEVSTSVLSNSIEKNHQIFGKKIFWKQGDLIGYGSFGEVYRAMNYQTGHIFAVKKIQTNKTLGIDKSCLKEIQSELNILKQIHHPNIVNYYDFEEFDDCLCIYFEYMSGGNISSLLKKYGTFPEHTIRLYSKQILTALSYIHSRNVIHKDIKGANILVSNSGIVKLADFGSAQQLEKSLTISIKSEKNNSITGSVPWMAPEVVRQTKYGKKSDVWSFGCTVLEMVTGNPPWCNYKFDNPIAAIMKIGLSSEIPEIPLGTSKELAEFLKSCLVRDKDKRSSVEELLKHEFILKEE